MSRKYLLDTGIVGHFVANRRGVRVRALAERRRGFTLGMSVTVLGELHFGVENSNDPAGNLQKLKAGIRGVTVWPYTVAAAREYGRLQAYLRRIGRPMQQSDAQIAAVALLLRNCTLVTADTDFVAIPGLRTENWAV